MAGTFRKCLMLCCTSKVSQKEDMATESYEEAIAKLTNLLSVKADLGDIAAAKIKQITTELEVAELEATDSKPLDPVERIKTGFLHFKKQNFEYVLKILGKL